MNDKTWYYVGALLLVAMVLVLVFKKRKVITNYVYPPLPADTAKKDDSDGTAKTVEAKTVTPTAFPLKVGSKGVAVEQLQRFLIKKGEASLTAAGFFYKNTEEALKRVLNVTELSEALFKEHSMSDFKTKIGAITGKTL